LLIFFYYCSCRKLITILFITKCFKETFTVLAIILTP
jgi:hypothetical protein